MNEYQRGFRAGVTVAAIGYIVSTFVLLVVIVTILLLKSIP